MELIPKVCKCPDCLYCALPVVPAMLSDTLPEFWLRLPISILVMMVGDILFLSAIRYVNPFPTTTVN